MKTALTVVESLIRVIGLTMIVLGVLFWLRIALGLIPLHMWLGFGLVVLLWALAALAARAGVSWAIVALAVVWGLVVPALGMTQNRLLPGSAHWVIQVLHLLVGLGALGLAETLATRAKRALLEAQPQAATPAVRTPERLAGR